MTRRVDNYTIKAVNFVIGVALLAMFCPHHGRVAEKPARVRTAIEMASKKSSPTPGPVALIAG